jgi:hypothetical protein
MHWFALYCATAQYHIPKPYAGSAATLLLNHLIRRSNALEIWSRQYAWKKNTPLHVANKIAYRMSEVFDPVGIGKCVSRLARFASRYCYPETKTTAT